jgi:hypothetical protein
VSGNSADLVVFLRLFADGSGPRREHYVRHRVRAAFAAWGQ